jgi:tetratricopeptide (TPR) repeat protein
VERLKSLGYISGSYDSKTDNFGPEQDVKNLLPHFNEAQRAWELFNSGKSTQAVEILKKIISEKRNIDLAHKYLAGIYSGEGKTMAAVDILEDGKNRFPGSYELFVDYVKALSNVSRYSDVIEVINRSDFKEAEYDPEVWINLGLAHTKTGDFESAIKSFQKVLALDGNYPQLFKYLGDAYFADAEKTKDRNKLTTAANMYKKAIELDPTYPNPYTELGKIAMVTNDLNGAINYWKTALGKDPNLSGALFNLGASLLMKGELNEAKVYLEKYKKLYYHRLTEALKKNLDQMIQKCKGEK